MQDEPGSPPNGASLAERVARRLSVPGVAGRRRVAAPADAPPAPPGPEAEIGAVHLAPSSLAEAETEPVPATSGDQKTSGFNIDFNRLQLAGIVTPSSSANQRTTEEFRVIKRHLLKRAFVGEDGETIRNGNVVMVTSAVPGEGKTFISLNLAMSLSSERDLYVLLVDCDGYRRRTSELLGVSQERMGLTDLLADPGLRLPDIILRTNIPNLSFIPAGRPHPHATELLASKKMGTLMDDLAQRYPDRMIIIDTSPVLAKSEPAVLSGYAGHIVLVVEKDRTAKRSLRRTLEMLEGCPDVSCILNMDSGEQRFVEYGY